MFAGRRISGGTVRIAIALVLVVCGSALFWASRDYAVIAPDWNGQVRGLAYSPSHTYTEKDHEFTPPEVIDSDMAQLAAITQHIRTYTVSNGQDRVPDIARRYGITVSLGAWIGPDLDLNEKELSTLIRVALANRNVDRVFVGSETMLRGDVSADQLNDYIRRVRAALPNRIKVSTVEPWSTWLLNPEIGQYVDFITINLFPYWEGVPAKGAMDFVPRAYGHIEDEFPDKPIVIGETGWPSEGRTRRASDASLAKEAYFIRNFVQLALDKGYDYYIFEAYDQPWKGGNEGAVGAYWGLYDADGVAKFRLTGALRSFPEWFTYAVLGAIISFLLGLLILGRMPRVHAPGYLVMGGLVGLVATGLLMLLDTTTLEYIQPSDLALTLAMIPLVFLATIIILTEGIELASSLWRFERRSVAASIPETSPRVCIHVPCYNEPPEMVIATLDALARLDYDAFDVLLLDNNTPDRETWLPVQAHCQTLGPRFRFVHMDNVKGFKAGALNEALKLTGPDVRYIAVIDSDYQVEPCWLRRALPLFASETVALVQGPQDYRDGQANLFKAMCFEEYRGFFQIGMVERNEHDAIIQHGTMMVVRKDALEKVGGWSEWCITEDTELGLKLFEAGYSAAYIPESMGKGLTPDTLAAFMSQRYRWVYGAMQIMKHHGGAIFLGRYRLTWAQRYQFLSGWLPWISDGMGLMVTFFALVWTALMTVAPMYFDVPMAALSAAALTLFFAKTAKTLLLYPKKVGSGVFGAVIASTAGLALTHTVGKAVIAGLFTSGKPFLRTPKCENPAALDQVMKLAWQEASLLGLLMLAIFAMFFNRGFDDPAATLWMIMLTIQALPYLATIAMAVISAMSYKAPEQIAVMIPRADPEMPKAA
ncbi:MAG TPA: glycosyltransferase family 2 protein [Rhizomicrobium sp.]|jgi:exo-beta-1,3-glucanase (GH17 family)/cellulose synthase/poly-beta-1,6-N-acetylglucosamine synthase-like glycosyltransferase|nr:glycosyltransferase family 2 protein [Rhizomicrobium sp.]